MGNTGAPILTFTPAVEVPFPVDVQRFDRDHFVGGAGLHGHTFHEIVVFESAGDRHRIGSLETVSRSGSLHAIGAGQVHDVRFGPQAAGWMVLFPDRALDGAELPSRAIEWFSRRGSDDAGRGLLSANRFARVERYLQALVSDAACRWPANDRPAAVLFRALLAELTRGHALQLPAYALYRHLERLLETLEHRYRDRITLGEIADTVGVTKAYLTTELREKTGRTAMQWLLERRLREARRLLTATELSITHIAHEVGFEDSSHFARRFRHIYGVSPLGWRNAKRRIQGG